MIEYMDPFIPPLCYRADHSYPAYAQGSLNSEPLPFHLQPYALARHSPRVNTPLKFRLERLLQNLSADERYLIEAFDPTYGYDVHSLHSLVNLLRHYSYTETLFSEFPHFAHLAFSACKHQLIHFNQLITLLMRWSAVEQFGANLTSFRLMNGTEFTQEAIQFLISPCKMSHLELEFFKNRCLCMEGSERTFWLIRIPEAHLTGPEPAPWAHVMLVMENGSDLFTLKRNSCNPEERLLVIPSFSICEAVFQVLYQDDAVELMPELKKAPAERLVNDIPHNRRVMAVHFPGIAGMETIENNVYSGMYGATLHDLIHGERFSTIPRQHRLGHVRKIHLYQHCIYLSQKYPNRPLLVAYWPINARQRRLIRYPALSASECEKLQQMCLDIADMDLPSCKYKKKWMQLRHYVKCQSPQHIEKPNIAFPGHLDPREALDPNHPEHYFHVAACIHDMAVHRYEWSAYLGIDVAYDSEHWREQPYGFHIAKTLFDGFERS